MAVRVKREPGSSVGAPPLDSSPSPRICYVCGAIGAAYSLNCRIRERGSYFPFLEQHDVPQGAARPTAEGVVISCMLCYSFLNQQWESYERNQTPHSKRLYWLKRADNGHYLGAEMRLQGEYASQIIGVSPEPGVGTGSGSLSNQHTHCTPLSNTAAVLRQPASGRCASVPHHQRGAATPQSTEDYYTSRDRCDSRSNSMVTYPVAPDDQEESYDSSSGLLDLRSGIGKTPNEASARNSRSKEGVDRTAVGDECSLSSSHPSSRKAEAPFGTSPANGALDLSMPDKNAATEACYMCGEEVLRGTLVSVYAKPIANCPFFPSLMLHPRPSHSRPMDPSGCVQACAPCYQHLLQQWDVFQRQNVPHAERRYQLWKRSASSLSLRTPSRPSAHCSSPSAPPPCLPTDFICFLCGQEFPWNLRHILYSGPNPEGEPPLPFLERVKPSRGAIPLSATGQALSCSDCYRAVHRQRHAYMDSLRSALSDEVPRSQGVFPKPLHSGAREEDSAPTVSTGRSNSSNVDVILPCHLCHQMIPRRRLRFSDVLFNKENIHTFLPTGIQEDGDGFPICLSCCNVLMAQWEQFEEGSVQYPQRRYVTPQLSDDRKMAGNGRLTDRDNGAIISSSSAPHVNMALRIKVPSPEQDEIHSGHSSSHVGAPLLTTVSTTSDSPVSVNSVGHVSVRNNVPLPSVSFSSALDLSSGSGGGSIKRRSLPPGGSSPQPPPNACGLPGSSVRKPHVFPNNERGTVCYVCGLRCKGSRTYIVRSFPLKVSQTPSSTSPDALTVSQMAFFPFLTMHLPPQDTETGGEDGTFITCTFCYHSLMIQWAAYEASRHPQDQNPWSRTYNCHDYVCYVCGVTTYRKRVKAISVADFPFLVSHPRPPHSLVLDGGDGVVVCLMCYETLSAQWNDFERMKVPLELRKYNWIAAPPPPEDEETPSATVGQLTVSSG